MSSTDRKRYQHLRGTSTEWASNNPTLAAGEIGLEVDTFKFKFGDGETAWNALPYSTAAPATSDMAPTGSITAFAGASAPTGWLVADGSAVSRTSYADLFAVIGTTWGAGDGSTTFNVPDLRGAFLRGAGTGSINGSDKVGPAVGAFQEDQMQGHHHSISIRAANGSQELQACDRWGHRVSGGNLPGTNGAQTHTRALVIGPVGDGTNGTPRTGTETRPYASGVLYIIKT